MIKKLYALVAIVSIWFILYLIIQSPAIPNPLTIIQYTCSHLKIFAPHLGASLVRITVSIFLAGLIGVGIGIVMGVSKTLDSILAPLVYVLYPIPKVAFLPVFMLLFGIGELPKIILIFSVIVFQFTMSTKDAIIDIDPSYIDSVKSLGLNERGILRHCILPAILPNLFTSIKITFGVSIAILFFAENFSTKFGLGYYIMNSYAMANYQSMYSGILILSSVGLLFYSLLDYVEKKVCPWIYE